MMRKPYYSQTEAELLDVLGNEHVRKFHTMMPRALREHSVDVALLLLDMSRLRGDHYAERLDKGYGGALHDVGKIGLEPILDKTEQLTEEDWQYIRAHPERGVEMIIPYFGDNKTVRNIVLLHHIPNIVNPYPQSKYERRTSSTPVQVDYRQGPRRDTVRFPEEVQMAAVADKYDALTSPFRTNYHEPIAPQTALSVVRSITRVNEEYFDALEHVLARELDDNKIRAA